MRNEIAVLKKVSKGHRNIVTLHDYFEVRPFALPLFSSPYARQLGRRVRARETAY